MLFYPRNRSPWQKRAAVPPGASLAYNLPRAHAPAVTDCWPHAAIVPPMQPAAAPHIRTTVSPASPAASAAPADARAGAAWDHAAPVAPVIAHAVTPADSPWDHAALTAADPAAPSAALRRAIANCGGQSALASAIGLTQSHVWNWLKRASIPAEHCPAIERATQRAVRCEELRPDVGWAYLRAVCEELAEAAGGGA